MDDKKTPSPWDNDIISSAPAPTPARPSQQSVGAPAWLGRPILHPDHANDLETNAAVNEFGLKMPRDKAEEGAYLDYVKGQRQQAAGHHLAGMRAARAAGDMEAARKHGLMYKLHSEALGNEPVGPVHPEVASQEQGYKMKFRPHRGDLFALDHGKAPEGVVSDKPKGPPPIPADATMGKTERDALYTIYLGAQALLSKSDNHDPSEYSEWIESIKGPGHYCHSCRAATPESSKGFNAQKPMPLHQHKESCQWRQSQTKKAELGKAEHQHQYPRNEKSKTGSTCSGCNKHFKFCKECGSLMDAPGHSPASAEKIHECGDVDMGKGEVVGKIGNDKGAEPQPKHKEKFHDIGIAAATKWAKDSGTPIHPNAPKIGSYFDQDAKKTELEKKSPPGRKEEVEELKGKGLPASEAFGIAWKQQNERGKPTKKGEMSPKVVPCVCSSYQFPHRHGSGKCGGKK